MSLVPLRSFEGPVEKVEPSRLHTGMDLIMVLERGRTTNDDNLVSILVLSSSVSLGDTVTVKVENGETSLVGI